MASAESGRKTYKLFVDGRQFESDKQYISGTELRALAGIASGVQVFLEEPGPEKPDRPVPPEASINLDEPGVEKFYTVPPATFGR
jgi:Multiubiquitin